MNVYAIVILVSLTFGACEQPNEIAPDLSTVEEDAAFELQWATRMDYEKEIVGTDHTQQYQGWMLIGGDLGFPPTIMAFNKGTGEKEWEYDLMSVGSGGLVGIVHALGIDLKAIDLQL